MSSRNMLSTKFTTGMLEVAKDYIHLVNSNEPQIRLTLGALNRQEQNRLLLENVYI